MIVHMLKGRRRQVTSGFALPAVLVASVVMLIVLLSSVSATSSVRVALDEQYYNKLAQEAAEAGQARAEACLKANNYVATWTDAAKLRPDTTCTGSTIAGGNKYIAQYGNVRTTFEVSAPVTGTSSSAKVNVVGITELTRQSNSASVSQTFSQTLVRTSSYNDMPQIASGAGWKAGGHNGYMLATNGTLYAWGDNSGNQIGDSSLGSTLSTPVKVALPAGVTKVKKVFNSGQGASILCILGSDDQAYCRGIGGLGGTTWTRFGIDPARKVIDMVVNGFGSDNACIINDLREAWCAGVNDFGQLGRAVTTPPTNQATVPMSSPTKFRLDLANPAPPAGTTLPLQVMKIEMKDWLTCVIASDLRPYCAGVNSEGQLGRNTTTYDTAGGRATPGRALMPGDVGVIDIKLPYHGSFDGVFYLGYDKSVYHSGHNGAGTSNTGNTSGNITDLWELPRKITTAGIAYGAIFSVGVEGDNKHTMCMIREDPTDGLVWCIGDNTYGQIGSGGACGGIKGYWETFNLPAGEKGKAVLNPEAGYQMNSVMVITTSGKVYAAGDNTYGKLGTGSAYAACNSTPKQVLMPFRPGSATQRVQAVALANGDEYTAFILGDDGRVYSMGRNNQGQLGDGTTTNRNAPVEAKIPRQAIIY
ncbi:MAG TPA: hypothetical protein VF281_00190 [Candidatus Saccharimonadales bacterium]